jgi:hypothetical protein
MAWERNSHITDLRGRGKDDEAEEMLEAACALIRIQREVPRYSDGRDRRVEAKFVVVDSNTSPLSSHDLVLFLGFFTNFYTILYSFPAFHSHDAHTIFWNTLVFAWAGSFRA